MLAVVIVSTRPGRIGETVAKWFFERAKQHGGFEVELIDLAKVNLPLLDEPNHPRLAKYEQEHTKAWSKTVSACDAFVFVTPEYNYSAPPTLLNAVDYLYAEWHYKACGFVSYGGISGGLRSVQMAKQLVTTLRMMPVPEGVPLPFVSKLIQNGELHATPESEKGATTMLDELAKWTKALLTLRA